MRYAHHGVKSKRTSYPCKLHIMDFDDRPAAAKRLVKAREDRGFNTPKEAATYFGWTYETYIQHEQGLRGITRAAAKYAKAFRVSQGWLLTGEGPGPAEKVSGEEAIKDLLRRIDGLPETAIEPVWGLLSFYLKDDDQRESSVAGDQSEQPSRRRESAPS